MLPTSGTAGPRACGFSASWTDSGSRSGQGEVDAALLTAVNNVAGDLFHYPAGQVPRTVESVSAMAEGKTVNPGALVVGPARD